MVNRFNAARQRGAAQRAAPVAAPAAQPAQWAGIVPRLRPPDNEAAALAQAIEASRQTAHAERALEGEYEMALAQSLAEKQREDKELAEAVKLSEVARRTQEIDEEALALALALSASEGEKGPGRGSGSSETRTTFVDRDLPRQTSKPSRLGAAELEGSEGFWEDPFSGPPSRCIARPRWADEAEDEEEEEEEREDEQLAAAVAASLAQASDEADEDAALKAAIEVSLGQRTRQRTQSPRQSGAAASSRDSPTASGGVYNSIRQAAEEVDEVAAVRAAIAASLRCPSGGSTAESSRHHSGGDQASEEADEDAALIAAIEISLGRRTPSPGQSGGAASSRDSPPVSGGVDNSICQAEEEQEAAALKKAIEESLLEASQTTAADPVLPDQNQQQSAADPPRAEQGVQAPSPTPEEASGPDGFLVAVSAVEHGFSIFDDPSDEPVAQESLGSPEAMDSARFPAADSLDSATSSGAAKGSNPSTIHFSLDDEDEAVGEPEEADGEMDSLAQWWHVEEAGDALEMVSAGSEQEDEWMEVGA